MSLPISIRQAVNYIPISFRKGKLIKKPDYYFFWPQFGFIPYNWKYSIFNLTMCFCILDLC